MNKVIKRIQIDLYSPTSYEVIKAQQNDNNSRVIELEILNQGESYDLSNVLVKFEGHRGNNSDSSFIKSCSISDNIVSVTLDEDVLHYPGIAEAKVVLYDLSDESVLSTIPFKIHIQKNPCNKTKVIETDKNLINDLIIEVQKATNQLDSITPITNEQIDSLF